MAPGPTLALSWLPSSFCSLLGGVSGAAFSRGEVGPHVGFMQCELLKGFSTLHEHYPFMFKKVLRRAPVKLFPALPGRSTISHQPPEEGSFITGSKENKRAPHLHHFLVFTNPAMKVVSAQSALVT